MGSSLSLTDWVLILSAVGTLAVSWYYGFVGHVKDELADWDEETLKHYRDLLADRPLRDRYRSLLEVALDRAEALFGEPVSWQAMKVCWLIALVYPILLFLFSWALGGSHAVGGIELLPQDWPNWVRLLLVAGYLIWFGMMIIAVKRSDEYIRGVDYVMGLLFNISLIHRRPKNIEYHVSRRLLGLCLWGVLFSVFYLATGDLASSSLVSFLLATAFGYAGDYPGSGALALTILFVFPLGQIAATIDSPLLQTLPIAAFVIVVPVVPKIHAHGRSDSVYLYIVISLAIFIVAYAFSRGGWASFFDKGSISIIVFLLILPLLNSLLDFASWAVSRKLGRMLLRRGLYTGIALALLDLLVATALLVMLVWVLCVAVARIDQVAFAKTGQVVLDLGGLLKLAASEPFSEGLWITAMLLSTLIPTVIHLGFAIGSLFSLRARPKDRIRWLQRITDVLEDPADTLSRRERGQIGRYLFFHRWAGTVALTAAILIGLGWLFINHGGALPGMLLDVAGHARSYVGG